MCFFSLTNKINSNKNINYRHQHNNSCDTFKIFATRSRNTLLSNSWIIVAMFLSGLDSSTATRCMMIILRCILFYNRFRTAEIISIYIKIFLFPRYIFCIKLCQTFIEFKCLLSRLKLIKMLPWILIVEKFSPRFFSCQLWEIRRKIICDTLPLLNSFISQLIVAFRTKIINFILTIATILTAILEIKC